MADYARSLLASNTTFTDQVRRMDRAVDAAMDNWQGEAAAAASARSLSESLAASHIDTAVIAIAEAHASHAGVLDGIRTSLLAIVNFEVPGAGFSVADDGTVTAPTVPLGGVAPISALMQDSLDEGAAAMEVRIKALLAQFVDGELLAAQAIGAAQQQLDVVLDSPQAATISPAVSDIISGQTSLPSDPAQLNEMWSTLSPADKDALFAHDNYIGNRGGLPVVDRDHYNRLKLADELFRAQAYDPAVSDQLADLQAIRDTIDEEPRRMLMLLDTQSGAHTHAAVAIGNPDTADHVSVTTPGVNTTVSGAIANMTEEGTLMKETAKDLLDAHPGHEDETVSTIAWIGYDAPQLNTDDLISWESTEGGVRAALECNAQAGAPNLSQFYKGIDASSHDGDPHLTAVGHSYGSVVTGLAMQQTPDGIVDDVVIYGSPGTGIDNNLSTQEWAANGFKTPTILDELNIEPRHAYEMTAHNDPVAHLNHFGWSPGYTSEFTHLDTDAATTADGMERDGASGHSEYARKGDNDELRTSGYNTAVVIAGLGEVPGLTVQGDHASITGATDVVNLTVDGVSAAWDAASGAVSWSR